MTDAHDKVLRELYMQVVMHYPNQTMSPKEITKILKEVSNNRCIQLAKMYLIDTGRLYVTYDWELRVAENYKIGDKL